MKLSYLFGISREKRFKALIDGHKLYRIKFVASIRKELPRLSLALLAFTLVAFSRHGRGGDCRISRSVLTTWYGVKMNASINAYLGELVDCGVVDSITECCKDHFKVVVNKEFAARVRNARDCYFFYDPGMLDYSEDCVKTSTLSDRLVLFCHLCLCWRNRRGEYAMGGNGPSDKCPRNPGNCDAAPRVALLSMYTGMTRRSIYNTFARCKESGLFLSDRVYLPGTGWLLGRSYNFRAVLPKGTHLSLEKYDVVNGRRTTRHAMGSIITFINPIAMHKTGAADIRKKAIALKDMALAGFDCGDEGVIARLDRCIDALLDTPAKAYRVFRKWVLKRYRLVFGTDGSRAAIACLQC